MRALRYLLALVVVVCLVGGATAAGAQPAPSVTPAGQPEPPPAEPEGAPAVTTSPLPGAAPAPEPPAAEPAAEGVEPRSPMATERADAPTPPRYDWSLGASLGFGSSDALLSAFSSGLGVSLASPSFQLSAERRLGEGTWLIFGGTGLYSSSDVPVTNVSGDPTARTSVKLNIRGAAVLLAIRRVVATSKVASASVIGGLAAGYTSISGDQLTPLEYTNRTQPGSTASTYGAFAAIALERELLEGLHLRLSANVASVRWVKTHNATGGYQSGTAASDTKVWAASITLQPSIELRFYF